MLGCAAEYLLINNNAYYKYLENNGTSNEIENSNAKLLMQNLLMIDLMNLKKDRIKYRYISRSRV